jgi:hypothetical protein
MHFGGYNREKEVRLDKRQRNIVILLTTLAVVIGISAVLSVLFDTSKELASIATWTPERWTPAPHTVIPVTPEPTFTSSPTEDAPSSTPKKSSCVYPDVYWIATADKLPAQITFKGFRMTKETVLSILYSQVQQETTTLLQQFIVANLNISNGADPSSLGLTLEYAEEWLNLHPVGSQVSDDDRQVGASLVVTLKEFNNGQLGPSLCSFVLPATNTPTVTPTPTPTRTRIYIPPTKTRDTSSGPKPKPTTKPPTSKPPNTPVPPTEKPKPTTAPTEPG